MSQQDNLEKLSLLLENGALCQPSMPKYHPIYIAINARNIEAVRLAFVYADDSIATLDEY